MNSAAPGLPPNSRPSTGPPRRKKAGGDPFFSGPKRVAISSSLPNSGSGDKANVITTKRAAPPPNNTKIANLVRPVTSVTSHAAQEDRISGFSDPRVTSGTVPHFDYKLVTTKKELLDGLRFHVFQLVGNKTIDLRDDGEFPKPAHLHRRDPLAAPPGEAKEEELPEPKDGLNQAEREELNKRKEIRQKEREANLAQIAPSQNTSKKATNFKKKTQQVFRANLTEEDKKRIQMNYEEKLPWHLEDFDNKHCYTSTNQQGSVNQHVAMIREPAADGSRSQFRLIPVEKLYHFKQKPKHRVMTADEVDRRFRDKAERMPEWFRLAREKQEMELRLEMHERQSRLPFTGAQLANLAGRQGEEGDMDFNMEDDFADDEEGALFQDKDEDEKLAETRIKEENLRANVFDMKEVKEWDDEEEREKKAEELRKKEGKRYRKALEKRERNYNHGSDSEDSSSTDSEEERARTEQERLKNLKKEDDGEDGRKSGVASGANTPSGRKEKTSGIASDREMGGKRTKTLKRPGSPNLSDASGTDTSTRKKHKSRHLSSAQPTPISSRPLSPVNVPSSQRPRKPARAGSGVGSDIDTMPSDREGAAMSDGERNRRLKLKLGGPTGPSRSASPGLAVVGNSISRPSSTVANGQVSFPTKEDIRKAITEAGGLAIRDLLDKIRHPPERRQEFIALVKQVARMDKERKVLVMKD